MESGIIRGVIKKYYDVLLNEHLHDEIALICNNLSNLIKHAHAYIDFMELMEEEDSLHVLCGILRFEYYQIATNALCTLKCGRRS